MEGWADQYAGRAKPYAHNYDQQIDTTRAGIFSRRISNSGKEHATVPNPQQYEFVPARAGGEEKLKYKEPMHTADV